jgi:hypothetical protein
VAGLDGTASLVRAPVRVIRSDPCDRPHHHVTPEHQEAMGVKTGRRRRRSVVPICPVLSCPVLYSTVQADHERRGDKRVPGLLVQYSRVAEGSVLVVRPTRSVVEGRFQSKGRALSHQIILSPVILSDQPTPTKRRPSYMVFSPSPKATPTPSLPPLARRRRCGPTRQEG